VSTLPRLDAEHKTRQQRVRDLRAKLGQRSPTESEKLIAQKLIQSEYEVIVHRDQLRQEKKELAHQIREASNEWQRCAEAVEIFHQLLDPGDNDKSDQQQQRGVMKGVVDIMDPFADQKGIGAEKEIQRTLPSKSLARAM
jgi:hypothetical protein